MAVVLALSACGGSTLSRAEGDSSGQGGTGADDRTARIVEIYSVVVRELTEDHASGGTQPPFERIFILDGVVEGAGDPTANDGEITSRFSAEVMEGIEEALRDLPPVEFVSDRDAVLLDKNECLVARDDGVLVSLGRIEGDAAKVDVPSSMWFDCRGGQWLTYVVERAADGWTVTGTTGPVAIS